jgi:hypothetical protein
VIQVIKEYKCSGPLLKYLVSENPKKRKEYVMGILYQVFILGNVTNNPKFSEKDVMNKVALRNENAVAILWELYKGSKSKEVLRLISSMCKTSNVDRYL